MIPLPVPSSEEFLRSAAIFGAYLGYMALGSVLLPGRVHQGTPIVDARSTDAKKPTTYRLNYKCNGLLLYVVVCASYVFGANKGLFAGTLIYDNIVGLLWVVNLYAIVLTLALYFKPMFSPEAREKVHYSGNFIKDLWTGVELNPHILGLDAKFFAYRPAMAGWTLVNLSVLFAQIQLHGTVSLNMAVYQLLSFTYVFDYFWHEPLMITTWDIIAEHFGYMLVWGDYVFITFCFSIQSWYLVHYPAIGDSYSPWMIAYLIADIALFLVGYTIFRGTNAQKANFKFTDGKCLIWGKEPKVIVTERGTKLLCSGWWGLARHINYTGDIIIALSMALPCVAGGFFAYLYPGYLVLLLLDRAHRDDRRCREKYGKDWVTYCNEVPHTFIPGIY